MFKKTFFLLAFLISSPLWSAPSELDSLLLVQNDKSHLFINNRILASVQGEPITVLDLTKRLDMVFLREFPQYASSAYAKFQFYQSNWKVVLDDMINKQLVKADAKESKVEISHGDVRQKMEQMFGPNMIGNLGKVGLTIEEAQRLVQEDLLIERMLNIRVNSKVFRSVTPGDVWKDYQVFSEKKENQREPIWEYRVITMSSDTPEKSYEKAEEALLALRDEKTSVDELQAFLGDASEIKLHVTSLMQQKEEELSEQFKTILLPMEENTYSNVIEQQSRANKSIVHRVFFLERKDEGGLPSFEEKEQDIRMALLEKEYEKFADQYYGHLNQMFDIQKLYLDDDSFQPFALLQ